MAQQLLFVCLGNICRSPTAENVMNHLIQQANLEEQIICDSAGTSNYHIGEHPDQRMAKAAQQQGITLKGHGRQLRASDLEKFDLILAMDQQNYQDILALASGQSAPKVRLICDFCRRYSDTEVPDPYFGGPEGFKYVIDLLLDACEGLLHHLKELDVIQDE